MIRILANWCFANADLIMVFFLRLDDERSIAKIAILEKLLENYAERLPDRFVVVTDTQVRFAD